jgi:hypothetical protein
VEHQVDLTDHNANRCPILRGPLIALATSCQPTPTASTAPLGGTLHEYEHAV